MIIREDKNELRRQRALRGKGVHGTSERPRLCVYRSLSHIYAQIIDDDKGVTLVAVNTTQPEVKKLIEGKTKKEAAFIIGGEIAKQAKKKKIEKVVFDRNGYLYTGRVSQVADGARGAGLVF
ncbi:MAG: 50S ribosomal protein L18 [Firmicutes bacterium]|nr:50S ribosomal protein L18 [Bacillota bacterium]